MSVTLEAEFPLVPFESGSFMLKDNGIEDVMQFCCLYFSNFSEVWGLKMYDNALCSHPGEMEFMVADAPTSGTKLQTSVTVVGCNICQIMKVSRCKFISMFKPHESVHLQATLRKFKNMVVSGLSSSCFFICITFANSKS